MADSTLSVTRTRSNTWIITSAVAGAVAGIVFAMFEMIMAAVTNGADAFFMPLRMIGGIGLGATALDPSTSLLVAGGTGIVIHMALSMMYGVAVAVVLRAVPPLARTSASVLAISSAAGFALWVVNFHVLARVLGWPWFPEGTNAVVQIVAHTVFFGTVLGIGLIRLRAVQPEG